ncbi:Moderate conductance mechanosensitive channel YbiO precursor [Magnetospirillum gryphiswaldense MSR-1]|uniref:MscS Mechanosensitive ion channel n=2 Tax=Magnetospirillum gryphiswaldense TaxID=55518 RepID=A4U3M0_9PROT|nr:Moderate conductance mechanosensitive channel YbiO precursor [Magnetospirillum gryphiswaldense MSR-1]AVM80044.1 Moderate conductance mechanosensitive channel YbiO precursor [Magnetospirillum gryphiswaldense]CAM77477.1 MscS Mechanosensitive ion channel [Magnetospirillum gryphiswaldense MSR-1]
MIALLRLFCLIAFAATAFATAQPARAQNAAEVERLVATLEDDSARAKLVGQLKLLLKAQNTKANGPLVQGTDGSALLNVIPDKLERSLWSLVGQWGGGAAKWLSQGIGQRLIGGLISILSALGIAYALWRLVATSIRRYLERTDKDGNAIERSRRVRTLLPLLRLVVRMVLTVMVALIILSELGVNIAPLLAGAGVVGIAVGFGAQKLVQDIITGIFILIEDTISIGDVVRIDSVHAGTVESMSIRALKLRDSSGALHSIPFSSVGSVTNMSKEFAFAVFDVGVCYGEDVDRVSTVLNRLGDEILVEPEWASKILNPLEVLGLERFDINAVIVRARFRTKALQQWAVAREFNRRIKQRFDAEGIRFPTPSATLLMGADGKMKPS